jgi:hypothetical protein
MLDFERGVEFGQALSTLRAHDQRITRVESDVEGLRSLVMRSALVALLWAGGMVLNLPADKIGETAGSFLKALQK